MRLIWTRIVTCDVVYAVGIVVVILLFQVVLHFRFVHAFARHLCNTVYVHKLREHWPSPTRPLISITQWKSDVWSLGCILYELAVLRSPFKEPGIKLHDLFKKIAKGIFEVSALAQASRQFYTTQQSKHQTSAKISSQTRAITTKRTARGRLLPGAQRPDTKHDQCGPQCSTCDEGPCTFFLIGAPAYLSKAVVIRLSTLPYHLSLVDGRATNPDHPAINVSFPPP